MLLIAASLAIVLPGPTAQASDGSPGGCRPVAWKPSSRREAHASLWKDAGRELPAGAQQVLIYSAGGHHIRFEDSIVATREPSGEWRLARVTKSISDVPPPPGGTPTKPAQTYGERTLDTGDALALERMLTDPSLDRAPAVCFPMDAPPIGEAQVWLEVSTSGRPRVFETFGIPAGPVGALIDLLTGAAKTLEVRPQARFGDLTRLEGAANRPLPSVARRSYTCRMFLICSPDNHGAR